MTDKQTITKEDLSKLLQANCGGGSYYGDMCELIENGIRWDALLKQLNLLIEEKEHLR